jgi:hypothetical protein
VGVFSDTGSTPVASTISLPRVVDSRLARRRDASTKIAMTNETSNRRTFLTILPIIGVVYCIAVTYWFESHVFTLIPLMNSALGTLAFRVFWPGIELWPITIVATSLRLDAWRFVVVLLAYEALLCFAIFGFEGWNLIEGIGLAIRLGPNLILQVPIWALTAVIVRLLTRARSAPGTV